MAYINIPNMNSNILELTITLYQNNLQENDVYISNSLNYYLSHIKKQITKYNVYWDNYKKITNPYEYIHTPMKNNKLAVCKYKPLSRSFFKMIEIINVFGFLKEYNNIKSFHLAEGPGGFIEAFNFTRDNHNDKYYGITLISDNINIPSWKKSNHYLNNNKKIIIETGPSKNGDLFLEKNFIYCYNNFKSSMDYITADGGFDFSLDFDKQEEVSFKLIITQVMYAIIMQKTNGNFILKIFDIFKYKTIEIIFLLSNLYENVYIYKPHTSRIANSEKYIICKNFKPINNKLIASILSNFTNIINNISNIKSLLCVNFPKIFINKIEEINAIYGQQQIENINTTLNLIREYINISYIIKNNAKILNNNVIDNNIIDNNVIDNNINNDINDDINNINHDINDDINHDYLNNSLIIDNFSNSPNSKNNLINNKNIINEKININLEQEEKKIKIEEQLLDKDKDKDKDKVLKFYNKISSLKNINIQKSISWCNKYNFTMNKLYN